MPDKTDKIKLIYYIPCLGTGGTERVVLNLCRYVSREEFEIEVCSMSDGLLGDEIRSLGIPVRILAKPGQNNSSIPCKIRNYLTMLATLHSMIEPGKPVVVHTHHYSPLLQLFFLRKFGRRRFGWLHTEHSRTDVQNSYSAGYYRRINPMRGPDMVSGVSDAVTTHMVKVSGIPASRSVTVLNGTDLTLYRPGACADKRQELGLLQSDRLIGTIGNLRREKNQQMALRSFSLVAAQVPNLHLIICGDGEYRSDLELLARDLGVASRVHFLGYRMDANEIMTTFDVYCLPSVYEGLPLSVLEAWAALKPVVATDVIGIKDIVRHENNGLLVPLNDDTAMAEALLRVLQEPDLAKRMSTSGHSLILKKYDLCHMISRYEELYKKIAI